LTTPQLLSLGVIGGTMLLFIWGRLRYDLVALAALLAALLVGVVPPDAAFQGFADDIVVIVGSALVLSAAVQRSGVVERLLARAMARVERPGSQLLVLAGSVTLLSALVKNIGALAMLMPGAIQTAKRSGTSPSLFLMPMAFGALLGGLMTLVGTSPNIIVARVRADITGEPFGMFDYLPVGLGLSVLGLVFLRFGYRLLPRDRAAAPSLAEALDINDYVTEARITVGTPADGWTVAELRAAGQNEVMLAGIHREGARPPVRLPSARLRAGDVVMLRGEPDALERLISRAGMTLAGEERPTDLVQGDDVGAIEAVVGRDSPLVGATAAQLRLHAAMGVNLVAVSRKGERLTERLRDLVLCPGDVIVLQGSLAGLPHRLRELGCLPLAERALRLGSRRASLLPLALIGAAMALTALGIVPVAIAFFAAAALAMLSGALPLRDAYASIEWPILIMLGALIPVSDSLRTTGASDVIAAWLSAIATTLPPFAAVALILAAAMAVTPFLNNAATVLVMAPIAANFADALGHRPDAFLMAVAVGAGCDFLTPIGHQCNTLVMGPGGYRFGDYARLGAPLSLLVLVAGVPLIMAVWPLG
jgi:di/tricarboxylate transporter